MEQARQQYGVVLVGGQVDQAATAAARAAMPPPAEGLFDFGPGRMALERRWPPALQDATIRLIETVPPSVRDWCKHRIYDLIQVVAATRTPTVQDVDEAWRTIRSRLTRALAPDGTPRLDATPRAVPTQRRGSTDAWRTTSSTPRSPRHSTVTPRREDR